MLKNTFSFPGISKEKKENYYLEHNRLTNLNFEH